MQGPAPLSPEVRRRALWLLVPLAVTWVASLIGTAFAPVLLSKNPLWLEALAPLPRHLVLISPVTATVPFILLGTVRLFLVDPFMYRLGQELGLSAMERLVVRVPAVRWIVQGFEKAFRKGGIVVLFLWPDPLMSLIAGAYGMRLPVFLAFNLGGTVAMLFLVRKVGAGFAEQLALIRAFLEAHLLEATLISVILVLGGTLRQAQKNRAEAGDAK